MVSVEDEVVLSVDEDESAFVSVILSSDSPQDESNTAVLISRTKQVNRILIIILLLH